MRRVIYSLTASLDGYITRADGSLDWIAGDRGRLREFFRSVDAAIMGRKSHDTMVKFAGPERAFYPGMKNYVVSRAVPPGERNGVEFVSGDLMAWVNDLRNRPGKKIWLSGGGDLARSFFELGLVDEISLAIQPILLGQGISLFPGPFPEAALKLESCEKLEGGLALLGYSILRS